MSADRPAFLRRRRKSDQVLPTANPDAAADQMKVATQRLRRQAWMISATTRSPAIRKPKPIEQKATDE